MRQQLPSALITTLTLCTYASRNLFRVNAVRVRHAILAWLFLSMLAACALNGAGKVSFQNPPEPGSWLLAQRELVACETEAAATYMANFGFFHTRCTQLDTIGPRDYQVMERQRKELPEGPMWLLTVRHNETVYWVPVPWHNWA